MIPRYYQRRAIDATQWGWEEENRIGIKLPTGAGKNIVASKIFEAMQPGRCLFIADQCELIQQSRGAIQRATGIIPAIEQAKEQASLRAQVVVSSSQSLFRKKRLERFPRNHFDYIISDEVHRASDRDQVIWDYFETAKVCGMTATPFRSNLGDLSKWLSKMVYEMDIIDLVEEGFAPPPFIQTLPVEINIENMKVRRGLDGKDYDADSVDETIAPYYETIAELVKENAKGRHGIAYLPLIRSSQAFASILRSVGLRAMHIDGTSDNRDAILHAFANGEIDWLCNSNLLSTGVDIPICDCFLNLKITQSRSWYQQARGRAMRVLPGVIDHLPEKDQANERRRLIANSAKSNCLLLDLLLQNDRLGSVHAGDDFCRSEYDAKQLFERTKNDRSPADIAAGAKAVQHEREAALVAALERAAIRSEMRVPLTGDQIAALLGDTDFLDYVPVQRWELEPPSKAQLESLWRKGVDTSTLKSKGAASELLDLLINRANLGYASVKQVKMIRQLQEFHTEDKKTPDVEKLTISEAAALIDAELKARRRAV